MQDSLVVNRRDSLVCIFNKMLRARSSREDTFAKFSLLLVARAEECACSNITLSSAMPSEEAIIITIVERIGLQKSKSKVLLWLGEEASREAWIELKKLSFDVNVSWLYESILPTCLGAESDCLRVNKDVAGAMVGMVMSEPYDKICNIACGAGQVMASAMEAGVRMESLLGAEPNFSALLIARIRMMMRGFNPTQVHAVTALTDDKNFQPGCYDVVLANPARGGWQKIPPIEFGSLGADVPVAVMEKIPYAYLLRGLALLKTGGRLAIVLPIGFLVEGRLQELRQFILSVADVLAIVTIQDRLRASASCLVILKRKQSNERGRRETFLAKSPRIIFDLTSSGRVRQNPYNEIVRRFLDDDRTIDRTSRWKVLQENGSWTPNAYEADDWYRQKLTCPLRAHPHSDIRIRDVLKLDDRPRDFSGMEFPRYVENTVHGIVERELPTRGRQLDFLVHTGRVLEHGMLLVSSRHCQLIANLVPHAFVGMFLSDCDQTYSCSNADDYYSANVRLTFISLLLRSKKYAHYNRIRIIPYGWQDDFLDYLIPAVSFDEMTRYYDLNEDVAKQTADLLTEQTSCASRITAAYDNYLNWSGGTLASCPVMPLEEVWVKQSDAESAQIWNGPILRNISVNENFLDQGYLEGLLVTNRIAKPIRDVILSRVPWGYIRKFLGRVMIPVPSIDEQRRIVLSTQNDVKTIRDGLEELQALERHHPVAARIDEEVFE